MYEEKWTLSKKPFENDLDLGFFFENAKHHKEAHVRLLYAAEQRKPLALLIGEGGVGKSYIAHTACAKLGERKNTLTAYISASGLEGAAFLRAVALAFGGKAAGTREEQAADLISGLVKNAKKGHAVLFVDNIEAADQRFLDEVRYLLDQTGPDGHPLMTVILVGHPRVRGNLKRRQSIVQRLEVGYELLPLENDEARKYILHRLSEAGAAEGLFDDDALEAAVKHAAGFPRLLNRICDLALLMGMIDNLDSISAKQVEDASQELADLRAIGSGGKDRDERSDRGGRDRERSGRDRERGERGERSERSERGERGERGERSERGGERSGRGRGRGRDRDRERGGKDDDEEGGRGRRRRRGRGRKDRDERNGNGAEEEQEGDEGSYGFDAEEYKDIESMSELIQGSLKVVPGSGRRRRAKAKRPERGDPLQYFGGKDEDEDEAEDEEGVSADVETSDEGDDESEERSKGRRRRRGRGRGRGRKDEDGETSEESTDDFAAGIDESDEREPVRAAAPKPAPKPEPKPEPAKAAVAAAPAKVEEAVEDDFAAGL